MEYYERLGLDREPFSNSPDPDFLFYSRQHIACLQEMEIAVRLKRGLNVVIGAVGTGKTTLIRRLIKNLGADERVRLHLVLDPYFKSAHSFLRMLCSQMLGSMPDRRLNSYSLKEMLKRELFRRGVDSGEVSVLVVDEGQKMTAECLEVLRELLNYETNNRKLLQILIFAQPELEPVIESMENFKDRINSYCRLAPFTASETREMINYRLEMATASGKPVPRLFTRFAALGVHRASGGYPRKAVRLCHKVVLGLLIRKRKRATLGLVREVAREQTGRASESPSMGMAAAVMAALVLVSGLAAVRYSPEVRALVGGIESSVAATYDRLSEQGQRLLEVPGAGPRPETDVASHAGRPDPMSMADYLQEEMRAHADPDDGAAAAPFDPAPFDPAMDPGAEPLDAMLEPAVEEPEQQSMEEPGAQSVQEPAGEPVRDRAELPELLGTVPVMPLENFSVMVRKVYGVYDRANAARVLAANPALRDADSLEVGRMLRFPLIDPGELGVDPQLVWLHLAMERDLAAAYGRVRAAGHLGVEARVLPYLDADGALVFAVVVERPFVSRARAMAWSTRLPLALQKDARALPSPDRTQCLGQMNELAWGVLQAMLED